MAKRKVKWKPRKPIAQLSHHRTVKGGLEFLDEPRPNVRVRAPRKYVRGAVIRAARAVLQQVKDNIDSQLEGRWKPIQYGDRQGDPALITRKNDWIVVRKDKMRAEVRPRENVAHIWRGHAHGMRIYSKTPSGMRFRGYERYTKGKRKGERMWITTHMVKLPKRDPRPTVTQIRRLSR